MSDHLEFRLLKYIVSVAETANFTRASERLFLAQPTLSQQVIALEKAIGVRIKVFRDPETHPAAHCRLMELLMEIGIRLEATCLAATPGDIQLMVQSGCGLALIDEKIVLAPNLR